jgi:ADP-heptose:LPS heptosyltransferase
LVWAGNPQYPRDRARSCPIERFAPVAESTQCAFFSLQKGAAAGAVAKLDASGEHVLDYTGELESFADTAALIEALDLVISVDTAVAHLAGALGKPVWILLPFASDWRWMHLREDSPWYPTARLFRQPRSGDWDSVLERVAAELARFTARG